MSVLNLTLLRHGTVDERPFVLWGQLDPPVSARGWADMQDAMAGSSKRWSGIISSPLQRCRTFAEQQAREAGLACIVEPDLAEMDFGDWQGLTPSECLERDGARYRAFQADPETVTPSKGESLADFRHRVLSSLQRWRAAAPDGAPESDWLCVTHAGVLRVLLMEWVGVREHWRVAVPPATSMRFALYEGSDPVLLSLTPPCVA